MKADDQNAKQPNDPAQSLEGKFQHVRDVITGIVEGYHTGLFLYGEGGHGKSYCVLKHLEAIAKDRFLLHNSRLSAWGLCATLQEKPDSIHVIEDAETLQEDPYAFGILRSALWAQTSDRHAPRPVHWLSSKYQFDFLFRGGIIIISNANLIDTKPELRALRTRINVLNFSLTHAEIASLIHQIAANGYKMGDLILPPANCHEIASYIVERLARTRRPPDLRIIVNSFRDYLQWQEGHSQKHWAELVDARFDAEPNPTNPSARRLLEIARAKQIANDPTFITLGDRIEAWTRDTGKSQAAYYRAINKSIKHLRENR